MNYLYLILYLVGYVLCYILVKRDAIKINPNWTRGDRTFLLAASLFSWAAVLIALAVFLLDKLFDNWEKPAKW